MPVRGGDPAVFEPGEDMAAGAATSRRAVSGANAFSKASANLTFEENFKFRLGNGLFRKVWVSSPASTKSSDGLGPLFNARACQRCHLKDGRGHPPANETDDLTSMLFRVAVPGKAGGDAEPSDPDPVFGGQLQDRAIQGHVPEGSVRIEYTEEVVRLSGGETVRLRRPEYRFVGSGGQAMQQGAVISPRVANPMIGLGLLEAIPEETILSWADPGDEDGDGVSGRVNRIDDIETGRPVLGRFGWKAGQPTVRQQSAAAFSGDMGLSSTLFPEPSGDCTETQTDCRAAPNGTDPEKGTPEVTDEMLDLVVFYARNLAVPRRPQAKSAEILAGKAAFANAGCASCHVPRVVTGADANIPKPQRGQTIWPYTDLLLHDMGEGLADGLREGEASGREWRTAPLWGIGRTKKVSGHTFFLHDGRARNLLEAILWHGGEAQAARDRVVAMSPVQRRALIIFLDSL